MAKRKLKLYQRIKRRFERNVILQRIINEEDESARPIPEVVKEYNIKAAILNQKPGYRLSSISLDNERQDTDRILDIYFYEKIEIVPEEKDVIIWNDKKYQLNKLEDNTIDSDFWRGEIIELSK